MRLIRREIERPRAMRDAPGFLYDFEKQIPFRHQEIRCASIPAKKADSKSGDELGKIRMAAEYAAESGVLMLIDVLKQSKKIVFSKDWEIGYRENNVINILRQIEKKRRKGDLLQNPREHRIERADVEKTWKMMVEEEARRKAQLDSIVHEISLAKRDRVIHVNTFLSSFIGTLNERTTDLEGRGISDGEGEGDGVIYSRRRLSKMFIGGEVSYESVVLPTVGDDNPPPIFGRRLYIPSEKIESVTPRTQISERYKKYLANFSKLNSAQSGRSNFSMPQGSVASHPSSQHIFKKVSMEYLRCKSARDIVSHKYRNVVIDRTVDLPKRPEGRYPKIHLQDGLGGDLCSSGSDDANVGYTFLIEAALGKVPSSGQKGELEPTMGSENLPSGSNGTTGDEIENGRDKET
ncbi:hypothetical protein P7C65_03s3g03990 [Encephalitozoon intestinalis]